MAGRPANAGNRFGALPLALCSAAVYVVVAGASGYLALKSHPAPPAAVAAPTGTSTPPPPPTTTTAATTTTTTTSTATTHLSPDAQRVEAPGGLTTTIPAGWAVTTGTVATTLVAVDPTSPRRELRLGGAPVTDPSKSLLDRITGAAADREREPGHRRITLTATVIRDHPAVTWEFDENTPSGGPRRVATAFWEANGVEYVLYSAGPPEEWESTRSRLTMMVDAAGP